MSKIPQVLQNLRMTFPRCSTACGEGRLLPARLTQCCKECPKISCFDETLDVNFCRLGFTFLVSRMTIKFSFGYINSSLVCFETVEFQRWPKQRIRNVLDKSPAAARNETGSLLEAQYYTYQRTLSHHQVLDR